MTAEPTLESRIEKKDLSEIRAEPMLLRSTPEEEDSEKTQIDQIPHFTNTPLQISLHAIAISIAIMGDYPI